MIKKRWRGTPVITLIITIFGFFYPKITYADGFIDFENGVDSNPIRSTIPGLQFTTTQGYDWVYGDWRTDDYNGPFPDGKYYSNGNFFAWLGPNQGAGRIDFVNSCATYLQVWVSSLRGLTADAYYADGRLSATASVGGNLDTGRMVRLRVDAPPGDCFSYVIFHDTGNYWLIDDLSTDAGGVPATRPPVIILHGLTGSSLYNYDSCGDKSEEIWPAVHKLFDLDDSHLIHLVLAENGRDPASNCDHISVGGIIREVSIGPLTVMQVYGPLIDYLKLMGFDVHVFAYDWRLDLRSSAVYLDEFVNGVLAVTGSRQVNIVDHSLGGLLARHYVTSQASRAVKVEQVISLGTPFLGAPETLRALRWGDDGFGGEVLGVRIGLIHPPRVKEFSQNSPAVYQILPSRRYFDVYGHGYYRRENVLQNWEQTRSIIVGDHNASLWHDAEAFHTIAMDDWRSTSTGVSFRLIVGSGVEKTVGVVHEHTVDNWLGSQKTVFDLEPTNGDGTVPLRSANLKGNDYDYSDGVPIWYTDGIDHNTLITQDYVIEFVGALLATPPNVLAMTSHQANKQPIPPDAPKLFLGSPDQFSSVLPLGIDAPPTPPQMGVSPFELDGSQIIATGVMALHLLDDAGNHTGSSGNGEVELGIPGSSYTTLGDSVFVTVPAQGVYLVEVESLGASEFDLKIRRLKGVATDFIQRTTVYMEVPLGSNGQATLNYDPAGTGAPAAITVDANRDGRVDHTIPPTSDLHAGASRDVTAPEVVITLQGQKTPQGWYNGDVRIEISSLDSESGILEIKYSTDGGHTIQNYIGPFAVQAATVSRLTAHAVDRAGNRGSATVSVGPSNLFIPIILPDVRSDVSLWRPANNLSDRFVLDIASSNASCQTVFAATDAGAYRSLDGGRSWSLLLAPVASLTPAVAVCPANPTIVYLTTWGGGVYRSSDSGNNWQPRNGGLSDAWLYDLAVDPGNCNTVYAVTNSGGVFKTTDGGGYWQAINNGLGNPNTRALALMPGNPNRLWVGTTSGVYRSTNGGASWQGGAGLPADRVWALAVAPNNANLVYAGLENNGVYRSVDGGATWQPRHNGLGAVKVRALAIDPLNPSVIYAGRDDGGGVYRRLDGGATWTAFNAGLTSRNVKSLWLDGGSCRNLLAGTTNGAWYFGP